MPEGIKNLKLVGEAEGVPLYEMSDISAERWNAMVDRCAAESKKGKQIALEKEEDVVVVFV